MKKRIFILVAEVLFIFSAVGAFLAVSNAGAASLPGTLDVTILNTTTTTTPPGWIKVYYDHNENNSEYLAGTHVGAEVCATGGDVYSVTATFSGFPAFDGNNDENEFELGRNEAADRDLGTISDSTCEYAYWYVATPRFKTGGTEIPPVLADGMTGTFTVTVNGADTPFAPVSDSDSTTMIVKRAIQAAASQIITHASESMTGYTLTVLYDLGNPGSEQDASIAPTGWITHDAGVFDLISNTVIVTRVQGGSEFPHGKFDNALYIDGLGANSYIGNATYVFQKVGPGGTVFYPYNIVDSGEQDKYNGDLGTTAIPLAITLRQINTGVGSTPLLLIGLILVMMLATATFVIIRRMKHYQLSEVVSSPSHENTGVD